VIRSMTGFGEASREMDGVHFSVEIRSLNNKFFKASLRLPDELQGLEPALDSRLRRRLVRGSITLTLRCSDSTAAAAYTINTAALAHYRDQLNELQNDGSANTAPIDMSAMLLLPGILQPPSDVEDRLERYRETILDIIEEACTKLVGMREKEGAMLLSDLHKHRVVIVDRLEKIAERAPLVVEEYHDRLRLRVETMLAEAGASLSEVDLIREVAIYAERSDISEEVSRLGAHLTQFRELIDDGRAEPTGRTLDFLAQEMLREANTIASKSNDAGISRDIVEIKGAIDRIKEQVQNVE